MIIRTIDRSELENIKPLWEKLNAWHLAKSTYFKSHFKAQRFENRMAMLEKRSKLIAFVAEENHHAIGYCIATLLDGQNGEIDSLFVDPMHRGQKVGEQLTSQALVWLQQQHCQSIRVSIAEGNEEALEFYRKFGFRERYIVMQTSPNTNT